MEYKDAVESSTTEETIVVSEDTVKLINKAIRKHKPKRPSLRGAGLTDEAKEALSNALSEERNSPQSAAEKAKTIKHLTRLIDKLEGTGPYLKAGPLPVDKFDINSWAEEYEHALPVKLVDIMKDESRGFEARLADFLNGFLSTDPRCFAPKTVERKIRTEETVQKAITDLLTDTNTCGTTVCACGYAATDRYFNKLGIKFDEDGAINEYRVATALGINMERIAFFFMPDSYEGTGTPKQVATRIRHFLGSAYFDEVRGA